MVLYVKYSDKRIYGGSSKGDLKSVPITRSAKPCKKAFCTLDSVPRQGEGQTDIKDSLSLLEYYKLKEKCKQ